jgi:outer membrane protein assembly factor BamB
MRAALIAIALSAGGCGDDVGFGFDAASDLAAVGDLAGDGAVDLAAPDLATRDLAVPDLAGDGSALDGASLDGAPDGGSPDGGSPDGAPPDLTPPLVWPQFGYDPQHDGDHAADTTITAANVTQLAFAAQAALPALVDGAPVYLGQVTTAAGVRDLLFVTTADGALTALDALTLQQIWTAPHPPMGGTCTNGSFLPCWTTSSPAIDPSGAFVYGYGLDGLVHKHQVGDGTEIVTGGWPEVATLAPFVEKGSSALAVATARSGDSYLYVTNAGYPGDAGAYQGHVTSIKLSDGTQHVFNTMCSEQAIHFPYATCDQGHGAVWARPGVIYDADLDVIFVAVGDGTFNGTRDWSDSVIALAPDGTGAGGGLPLDSYTPTNYAMLDAGDLDLGSAAPAVLPTPPGSRLPHLAVQAGKDELLRLLNLDNLSGQGKPGQVGGEVMALTLPQGGSVPTQPATWSDPTGASWVFVVDSFGACAVRVAVDGSGNPSLPAPPANGGWTSTLGGTSPVIVGGILYYSGTAASRNGMNTVYALDPSTGNVLWSAPLTSHIAGVPTVGGIHWESPIVVGGRLYVPSENGDSTGGTGQGYVTLFALP